MRWIGACLVTAGCTGLGRHMAQQWRLRLRWLEQLRQMIYFLKGEILYGHTALGEALERVGKRCQRAEGERGSKELPLFFLSVARRIQEQEGEAFSTIWREELDPIKETPLKEEDVASLQELGKHLGYLDLDMQERYLPGTAGRADRLSAHAPEREDKALYQPGHHGRAFFDGGDVMRAGQRGTGGAVALWE